MTKSYSVLNQKKLAVTPLLLRCISNFIYCELLESYPFHSFFIGKTCGISDEIFFSNITKPLIQSLKADLITLSHSLFFDHTMKVLFKTTKYKNCEDYKRVQEFIKVQRDNIAAHFGDLDKNKIQGKPYLENYLVTNSLIERPNFLGKTKATEKERVQYFGPYIKSEEFKIKNSSYGEEWVAVRFAKSDEAREMAITKIKQDLIDSLHNSTYTISLERIIISIMLKLYDEFYKENQNLLMHKMVRFAFPLLSKIDYKGNQNRYYLDQFFCEEERKRSRCFYVLEEIHKSRLAESIQPGFDKNSFKE